VKIKEDVIAEKKKEEEETKEAFDGDYWITGLHGLRRRHMCCYPCNPHLMLLLFLPIAFLCGL
jgi:hypothetical protein